MYAVNVQYANLQSDSANIADLLNPLKIATPLLGNVVCISISFWINTHYLKNAFKSPYIM